ncbi:hypothetical protein BDZ89DRAFT_957177 [Hymenopellis radicata]|nr:hypothetical protein BDZ89DRAFT_957177 [Hymenopellis radicata]
MSLDSLPAELYHAIISFLGPEHRASSVLALSRAIPRSPVPTDALFTVIKIYKGDRVLQLYHRLRVISTNSDGKTITQEFHLECWDADADLVINLVTLLKQIKKLTIKIGPRNFTPEHLEEMTITLRRDMPHIEQLEFRFRPYVEKATYLPFLKGSYFDSTLIVLSEWPHPALKSLSIIQEPLDSSIVNIPQGKPFAQPIVFFRLDSPLGALLSCKQIASLRFHLPSRQLSRAFTHNTAVTHAHMRSLDLSTANITDMDVDAIITRFSHLEHLILDGCIALTASLGNTAIPEAVEDPWYQIGKRCALGGSRRAREYEKMINKWLEATNALNPHLVNSSKKPPPAKPVKVKKGRSGLATATISLRERGSPSAPVLPPPPPLSNVQQRAAQKKENNLPPRTQSRTPSPVPPTDQLPEKIRVLAPAPTLKSLCIRISKPSTAPILAAFTAGWTAGVAQICNQRRVIIRAWVNRGLQDPAYNNITKVVHFDKDAQTWERLDGFVG